MTRYIETDPIRQLLTIEGSIQNKAGQLDVPIDDIIMREIADFMKVEDTSELMPAVDPLIFDGHTQHVGYIISQELFPEELKGVTDLEGGLREVDKSATAIFSSTEELAAYLQALDSDAVDPEVTEGHIGKIVLATKSFNETIRPWMDQLQEYATWDALPKTEYQAIRAFNTALAEMQNTHYATIMKSKLGIARRNIHLLAENIAEAVAGIRSAVDTYDSNVTIGYPALRKETEELLGRKGYVLDPKLNMYLLATQ